MTEVTEITFITTETVEVIPMAEIGPAGPTGAGAPAGGATGAGLVKRSTTDFDFAWVDIATQVELNTEVTARAAADTTLQTNITAEATARAAAVTAEAVARAAADALLIPLTQKAAANGVATLGSDGVIPTSQMPAIAVVTRALVANQAARLALTAVDVQPGDVAVQADTARSWLLIAADPSQAGSWKEIDASDLVTSVNGQVGVIVLGPADVGADVAGSSASEATARAAADTAEATARAAAVTAEATARASADTALQTNITAEATARAAADTTLQTNITAEATARAAADTLLAPLSLTLNAQTGTTYTFVLADAGAFVTLSNASAITATIPPNSSVAFPVGSQINMAQIGAGQVTVAAGAGVTINSTPGLKARAQYSAMTAIKTATNTWLLVGDLSA